MGRGLGWSFAAALLGGLGCGAGEAPAPPPHIVVVLVDTLRADHTGLHGYRRDTTPHLERIAAEGLVLRRHLVNAPWTKPSVASILTGLHPSAHGARLGFHRGPAGQRNEVLSPALLTLPEALAARGYATFAWVTNAHLRGDWGFGQGYQVYAFARQPAARGTMPARDRAGIDFTLAALEQATGPTFVWTHLMGVHQYEAPAEHRVFRSDDPAPIPAAARQIWRVHRYPDLGSAVADYDNAIRAADAEVGRLFDAVRARWPGTVLVVTSDHGEEFHDHGGFAHGHTLYNELLWVPCVLWGPGVPRGAEVDGLTDSLDLFPTLLRLAGGEGGAGPGRPLIRDGAATAGKRETLAEHLPQTGPRQAALLRANGYKLIVSERPGGGAAAAVELYADGHRVEGRALDPSRHAAEVTREVSRRLAVVARALEAKHHPEEVAGFIMRCLFCMFAEDVGLLPDKCFSRLLETMRGREPTQLVPALETLWTDMDRGSPFSGIAANPYIAFFMRVPGPGTLTLTWIDDGGTTTVERVPLGVA